MRRLVLAVAAAAVLLAGCGGSAKAHLWLTPSPRLAAGLCVSADCGPWTVTLNWQVPSFPNTTGYNLLLNGAQYGTASSTPFSFSGSDCGQSVTLGVQAHNGSGGTGPVWSIPYSSPACPGGPTANFFVAQSSAGSGNGSSCANAEPYTWFNTATNWGAGKPIAPGVIVGLCGTITGAGTGTALTAQGSGTSGNPITVLWEPGAVVQEPVCSGSGDGASGCIDIHGRSFITLNGGSNGIIQSTTQGTALSSHTAYADGVYAESCSGCTIENLTIQNMYVEGPGSNDCSADSQGNVGVWYSGSNTTLTNDTFSNEADGAMLDTIGPSDVNMTIANDTFTNIGTGMNWVSNTNGGGTAGPILFDHNTLSGFNLWDSGASDCYHEDGIHCWDGTGFTPTHYAGGMLIYDNVESGMDDASGVANGYTFMEGGSVGSGTICADTTSPIDEFNNVLSGIGSNGLLGTYSGEPIQLNNTFLGGSSSTGICSGVNSDAVNTELENNAVQGCGNLVSNSKASIYATGQPNNNLYSNSGSNAFICVGSFINITSFATWQTCARSSLGGGSGAETNSSTQTSLGLNTNGSPQVGSVTLGAGANLTSLCTGNLVPLCSTITGAARPTTGAWNVGAY